MSMGDDSYAPPTGGTGLFPSNPEEAAAEMNEAELERIFKHFDSDGSGSIDCEELRSAMLALGIKTTMNTCKKLLAEIDQDGNGTIEWDEFSEFFARAKDPEEIKKMLAESNKKYLEYKAMVEGDPNFERRFYVPPVIAFKTKFRGHEDNVEDCCWLDAKSPNFLTCSLDGYVKMWDVNTGKLAKNIVDSYSQGIYSIKVLANSKSAISGLGSKEENVVMWDLTGEKNEGGFPIQQLYNGPEAPIYSVGLEKNTSQKFFVAGAKNGHISYFDASNKTAVSTMTEFHEGVVYSCDFNKDNVSVVTASSDGTAQVIDVRNRMSPKSALFIDDVAATGVCYKALWKGQYNILSCGEDYCVKMWDTRKIDDGPVENFLGHTSVVREICISADEKYLLSATNDGCIRTWVIDERRMIKDEAKELKGKIQKLEKEREKFDHDLYEGEELDDEGQEKLRSCIVDLDKSYRRSRDCDMGAHERDNLNCIQGRSGLDGHTLPVTSVAWRDHPDKPHLAQVISGAQDMSSLYFEIKKPKPEKFMRWNNISEDAKEAGLSTKQGGGY